MSDVLLTKEQIQEIIPHRNTMLLIDEITELEPGVRAVGRMHLSGDEVFFDGHFPGYPILPGVFTMEALAQTGAVAILSLPEYKGKIGLFGGLDKVRFKEPVRPGDTLELSVEIIKRRGPIGIGKGVAYVNGKKAASGELTFAIQ
ncbi:3-hydroxyacyl-ACP dehydratase FabZ [Acetanaerobacterium sp. MSJ-12]|uniref:3-hydroxyacyl-[acyl-carrier-protein] dehydratase n=1 Tax=Bittarella massiliensis (ex Durand et al. 2017) TaxID=1720313 RepID=A0AAP1LHM0_9FIRM|nr:MULTISPECIES: 3-hydroxyacyl-ACP dehydratase FabZ [Eubacteriales]MCB5940098.1 3-hydroxyacyl-ACP dehydratase FabZ [bacterium 210820-DFI.6.52]ERI99446.1 (3R)-hydroxymyristoyl-ACP dehydratase [Clostridium sp. ATCC 29733]MBC2871564.1 3-hydroxyacyl-ACP dehydratase FabZ [Bittarella massiliensis (ex Durand et al. 2017)]MBO1678647.1 3-hydroxyacyl-ACP dehydratase FabZ [Bittarella massiliensis (ex Durand et al. 2017)]MBU5418937.1 3-hydroxyacyl-ACP dehydratase FabZ [Acetanaerobacterium sp. MSJ-12]